MTKNKFLETLEKLLSPLPYDERRDILYNYEEHFKEKLKAGFNEETVVNNLPSPEIIAKKYLPALPLIINSTSSQVLLIVLFIFLNLFFILPTYIGIVSFDLGMLVALVAIIIAGLAAIISIIVGSPIFAFLTPLPFIQYPVLVIAGLLALISISALLFIAFAYILKFIIQFTGMYVRWMGEVVRGY